MQLIPPAISLRIDFVREDEVTLAKPDFLLLTSDTQCIVNIHKSGLAHQPLFGHGSFGTKRTCMYQFSYSSIDDFLLNDSFDLTHSHDGK